MAYDIKLMQHGNYILDTATGENRHLNRVEAGRIGGAFAWWLAQKVQKNNWDLNICVGYDSRLSSPELREGIMTGFQMFGAHNHDAGLATAATMAEAPNSMFYEFDAGVMITGGSAPGDKNGFRFFTKYGEASDDDIAKILEYASKYVFVGEWYEAAKTNVVDMYAAGLRRAIAQGIESFGGSLKDMHIVVDAGNGASGFFASKVLGQLGADVSGSQFLEPDGNFPNHEPNPEDEKTLELLCKAVSENNADLGIALDSDGDRCAVVSPDGKVLAKNEQFDLAIKIIVTATQFKKEGKNISDLLISF